MWCLASQSPKNFQRRQVWLSFQDAYAARLGLPIRRLPRSAASFDMHNRSLFGTALHRTWGDSRQTGQFGLGCPAFGKPTGLSTWGTRRVLFPSGFRRMAQNFHNENSTVGSPRIRGVIVSKIVAL